MTPIFLHFGILHILFNMLGDDRGRDADRDAGGARCAWRCWCWSRRSSPTWVSTIYMEQTSPTALHLFGGLSGVGYALFGYLWMKGSTSPSRG